VPIEEREDSSVNLQIEHLLNHPERVRLVAGWIYNEFWRDKPGYSVETFEHLLRQANDVGKIPLSLLAIGDGEPAGTVNLVESDSPSRPSLHPWLAALYVEPRHRGRGIGRALCLALIAEARRPGVSRLYLGSDIPGFYTALGAEVHEQLTDSFFVMRFSIGPAGVAALQ
jgi:GNAT superfamily N-acetyltransferase